MLGVGDRRGARLSSPRSRQCHQRTRSSRRQCRGQTPAMMKKRKREENGVRKRKQKKRAKPARALTREEQEELLRLAASHKRPHRGKQMVNWKEVHKRFSTWGGFTRVQLQSRWEVLKQTSTSTARARQCSGSLYGGDPRNCQRS